VGRQAPRHELLAGRGQVTVEEQAAPGTLPRTRTRTTRRRYAIMLGTAAFVIALDHLTKWLVTSHIPLGEQVPAGNAFVNIHDIQNSGAAFSIGPGLTYIYLGVALVVAVYIVAWGPRMTGGLLRLLALGCILGGSLSNGIDRLVLNGNVTDFIDFHWWPVFNCADMAIVGGMLVAVYEFGFSRREEGAPARHP